RASRAECGTRSRCAGGWGPLARPSRAATARVGYRPQVMIGAQPRRPAAAPAAEFAGAAYHSGAARASAEPVRAIGGDEIRVEVFERSLFRPFSERPEIGPYAEGASLSDVTPRDIAEVCGPVVAARGLYHARQRSAAIPDVGPRAPGRAGVAPADVV